jgi:hypothetical protein
MRHASSIFSHGSYDCSGVGEAVQDGRRSGVDPQELNSAVLADPLDANYTQSQVGDAFAEVGRVPEEAAGGVCVAALLYLCAVQQVVSAAAVRNAGPAGPAGLGCTTFRFTRNTDAPARPASTELDRGGGVVDGGPGSPEPLGVSSRSVDSARNRG